MRTIRASEIPEPARALLTDVRATFFFQPEWTAALAAAYPNAEFQYLLLEEDGVITAVLPMVRVPHGPLHEVVSMPFGTHGGPLMSSQASALGLGLLNERFRAMVWRPDVFRFELSTYDPPPHLEADLIAKLGRDLVRSQTPVLELAQGEESIWNGYDTRLRRSVRRADTFGVVVEKGDSWFPTFYDLYASQAQEWPLPWHHRRDRLEKMLAVLGDRAEIWVGLHEGRPVCSELVLYQPGRDVHFWVSGKRPEARPLAAYHFLLNAIILDAGRRGFAECHFGSSLGNPGVERFKLAYGAVPRTLLRFFHQPRWVGWVQQLRW